MTGQPDPGRAAARAAAPLPVLAAVLVLIVLAWYAFQLLADQLSQPGCARPATIEVAADPAIEPVLSRAVDELAPSLGSTAQTCFELRVTSQEAGAVADRLTGRLSGTRPDVWIPESTFWLGRASAAGALDLPEAGASLAASPVVLAVAEPAARRLGWPERALTWQDVLSAAPSAGPANMGMPDPARSSVGLAALFNARAAAAVAEEPAAALVAALRRLSPNVKVSASELFDQLPPAADAAAMGTAITAFPASEQAVLRHNQERPDRPLVPVYPAQPMPVLDYPYVVLPTVTEAERAGAVRLLETLIGDSSVRATQERGLRTPQGEARAEFPAVLDGGPRRPDMVTTVPLPGRDATDEVLRIWTRVNLSARMLTVIDVSGSMGAIVPGIDRTRAEVTAQAAKQGLGLFKPTTDMGLWVFSENLDGERDHRELAPIAPLATERERLMGLTDQVAAMVGGRTNLFDTVLAAYQTVLQGWDAARLNVVVVLTDGRDDDVSSIDRQQLVDELTRLQDPERPARIIFVGIGPDVDAAELDQIAAVTGGRAFTTPDPAGIRDVFARALAELTCAPPDCG